MQLIRHKQTGNVYGFNQTLMHSGDYELLIEPEPELVVAQPEPPKVTRRKRYAIQTNGEPHGANPQ